MKKQRIFSLLFAFLLVFTLSFPAMAAQSAVVTVEAMENPVNAGEDVTLKVSISGNPGFTNLEWNIEYDTDRLELKAISTDRVVTIEGTDIHVPYMSGFIEKNVKHPSTGLGYITRADSTAKNDDGTLFLLTFLVKQNAPSGNAFVKINSDLFENDDTPVDVTYEAGSVAVNGTTGGSTTGGSTTGGSTTGGSTTGGSTTGGSTTGGSTTGGSTTGGSTTGGSTTGGSTTGGSTTGGSTTGGSTTGGSTTGGSTTGGSTTGGETTVYTVTVRSNGHGEASATPASATAGTEIVLSATPETGYRFKEWKVVAGDVKIVDNKFTMPASNVEIEAAFEHVEYTISFDVNGGTGSVAAQVTVGGKLATLPEASRSGSYSFKGWYTQASGGEKITPETVFTADMTVYAQWTYTGTSSGGGISVSAYSIIVEDAKNGDVTANRSTAAKNATVTLTVTPDKGYTLKSISVVDKNGAEVKLTDKDGKYTFTMPASKVTVKATFKRDSSAPYFFTDVPADAYYYDAVVWAFEEDITCGTTDTTFSPDLTCTRAQAITFLWRIAGSPTPKSSTMAFKDVAADAYYYNAVLWGVENGLVKGADATTFSPDAICSRAQFVTLLWRSQATPAAAAGAVNPFTDVNAGAYYANAVLWAVNQGLTKGTSETTFSPDDSCTRAQMVTFLYRYTK